MNNLGYFKDTKADKIQNVVIGNNVIVGAHSVVTKNVPDNCVICGVPAKYICSIDEYYQKNKEKFECMQNMSYDEKKIFILINLIYKKCCYF